MEYQFKTSDVIVDIMREWIETDDCIEACRVDRNSIGISTNSILCPHFIANICPLWCYNYCPNIVDLYFNLALAEGVHLPSICAAERRNPHRQRAMMDILSSGQASGPASAIAAAPITEAPLTAEHYYAA